MSWVSAQVFIIDFIIQIKSRNIEIEDLKISAACLENEKRK